MSTISKELVIKSMQNMPDEVELDDFIEQLILISKIERGRRQADSGQCISIEEAKEKMLYGRKKS